MVKVIKAEVQTELMGWLVMQPPHAYERWPVDARKWKCVYMARKADRVLAERHRLRAGDHYNSLLELECA